MSPDPLPTTSCCSLIYSIIRPPDHRLGEPRPSHGGLTSPLPPFSIAQTPDKSRNQSAQAYA